MSRTKPKSFGKTVLLFALMTFFSLVNLTGCKEAQTSDLDIAKWSFRDVPGITEEEIQAIEQLQRERESFIFGKVISTEAFVTQSDSASGTDAVGGFSALFCEWLSNMFGIPFEDQIIDILQYLGKLAGEESEIDFLGDFSMGEGQESGFFITDPISTRWIITARTEDSLPLDEIAQIRPIRYAFPVNHPFIEVVASVLDPGAYKAIEIPSEDGSLDSIYRTLKRGEADALILDNTAEFALDFYPDLIIEDFQPLLFNSAYMATRKPELEPIISVVNKALRSGGARDYLNTLYHLGYDQYRRNKLLSRLSEEEKEYIQNNPVIPLAAHYWFYPVSYYDEEKDMWSGASIDVLNEVEKLTGFTFEVINHRHAEYPELIDLLLSGKAYIKSPLIYEENLKDMVIWPGYVYFRSRYTLLSKRDFPNINSGDIPFERIGLIDGSPYSSAFKRWFPDAENAKDYTLNTMAFDAVERGEIDMVMGSPVLLSHITNYFAYSGYKTNYIFNYETDYNFGINRNHAVLASILEKTLPLVDTDKIVNQWMTKTYDYQSLLLRARMPWLIGAVITLALILVLVIIVNRINRKKSRTIAEQAAMLDTSPLCIQLIDRNHNTIGCNDAAVCLYNFESKEEFIERFFRDCSPKYQPDGQLSSEKAVKQIDKAFEEGRCLFDWMHQMPNDGSPIPTEISLVRVSYKDDYLVVAHTKDLREVERLKMEVEKIYYDPLTGIYNRRFFDENLELAIKTLSRGNGDLSLFMIDIDFFKKYNDTYGHIKGDKCIKIVAETLSKTVTRAGDFVVRYGGEEFAVVLPNTSKISACVVAEKLLQNIRNCNIPHEKNDTADCVTISIGVVTGKAEHTQKAEDYIKRADEMLYLSKQSGRDKYTFGNME